MEIEVSRVSHDTDDFVGSRLVVHVHVNYQMLADWVFVGEEIDAIASWLTMTLSACVEPFLVGEGAAANDRDLQRREVSGIAEAPARDLNLSFG